MTVRTSFPEIIFGASAYRNDANKISFILGSYQDYLDAKVDIPMFEYCEQSVCLGNGGDEAKKAADMVTQAVDDDGLASAFYKLGLI